jgi:hypothetical protein
MFPQAYKYLILMNGVHSVVKKMNNEWGPFISPSLITPMMDNEWAHSMNTIPYNNEKMWFILPQNTMDLFCMADRRAIQIRMAYTIYLSTASLTYLHLQF